MAQAVDFIDTDNIQQGKQKPTHPPGVSHTEKDKAKFVR